GRGLGDGRPDGLVGNGDGDAFGAGGDGIVDLADAGVGVELGVVELDLAALLLDLRFESLLLVDEILLIRALVDADEAWFGRAAGGARATRHHDKRGDHPKGGQGANLP